MTIKHAAMDRIKYMVRISIENVMALCVLCSLCVCVFVCACSCAYEMLHYCFMGAVGVFPSLDGC